MKMHACMPSNLLCIVLGTFWCACDEATDTVEPDVLGSEEIDTIRDAVDQSLGQGLATAYSIAVWRDGRVIFAGAYGASDDAGTPATPDTQFVIGSDTKKVTAIALLRQVEAGALSLEEHVADVLPELVLAAAPEHFKELRSMRCCRIARGCSTTHPGWTRPPTSTWPAPYSGASPRTSTR